MTALKETVWFCPHCDALAFEAPGDYHEHRVLEQDDVGPKWTRVSVAWERYVITTDLDLAGSARDMDRGVLVGILRKLHAAQAAKLSLGERLVTASALAWMVLLAWAANLP